MVHKGTLSMLGEPCLGPHFLPIARCFQGWERIQGEKGRDGDHSFAAVFGVNMTGIAPNYSHETEFIPVKFPLLNVSPI
jgi:hypothetical protein